jgi:L-asparaginase
MTKKCHIRWIATGGTIAGSGVAGKSSGYQSADLEVEELMQAIPQLREVADWSFSQPISLGSQHLMQSDWFTLTNDVNAALEDNSVDAVVITHGTDSLEETAFWLHLTLPAITKKNKPVVLTAAMRPSTALSADGPANIYQSAVFAKYLTQTSSNAIGNCEQRVWAVLQNRVYAPPMLKKINCLAPDAFGKADAVAHVLDDHVMWRHRPINAKWPAGKFARVVPSLANQSSSQARDLPDVVIIKCHVEMNADRVRQMLTPWPAGIVIEGFGHGSIPRVIHPLLEAALADSVVLVRASRTPYGPVFHVTEADELSHGVHSSGVLNAVQARIALALTLAAGDHWPDT